MFGELRFRSEARTEPERIRCIGEHLLREIAAALRFGIAAGVTQARSSSVATFGGLPSRRFAISGANSSAS